MNKQMKQHLDAVIDALVESDTAAAKDAFHDYLRLKTQAILIGESVESEEDDKDDKKKPDADGDGKPDWADKKDDKKSDKKEEKDDKKSDKKKDEEDCEM